MTSTPEDVAAKIAVNLITEIFKEAVKGVKELAALVNERTKGRDFLGCVAKDYQKRLIRRYNVMRIFGMTKPVPLESIYTRVNILERITATRRDSVEQLTELLQRQRRFGQIQASKPGLAAVNDIPRFVLLGKPGSGKTTFLKHVALHSLGHEFEQKLIPIFISLKALSDSGATLGDFICHEFKTCGVADAERFAASLLENGKCRVLLDGLDEVSDARRAGIIDGINHLSDECPGNQYIVTCRVAAYSYSFEKFTDVEMADFGEEEIIAFLQHWWPQPDDRPERCWRAIQQTDGLREMAATPLLLTLLCLAYEDSLDLSTNRAELYKDAIEALLKKWDTSRNIQRDEVYRQLTAKRKEDLFCEIAAESFEQEQYFFQREDLEDRIGRVLRKFSDADEYDLAEMSHATLRCIKAHHGLIVERSKGIHSFSHLTFQEYFTARYISLHGPDSQRALVRKYLTDVRWREVVVLVACLLPDAEDFIIEILSVMSSFSFTSRPLSRIPRSSSAPTTTRGWGKKGETLTIRPHARGTHLSVVVRDLPARMREVKETLRLERRELKTYKERLLDARSTAIASVLFPHTNMTGSVVDEGEVITVERGTIRAYLYDLLSLLVGGDPNERSLRLAAAALVVEAPSDLLDVLHLGYLREPPRPLSTSVELAARVLKSALADAEKRAKIQPWLWSSLAEPLLARLAHLETLVRKGTDATSGEVEEFRASLSGLLQEQVVSGMLDRIAPQGDEATPRDRRFASLRKALDGPLRETSENAIHQDLRDAFVEDCRAVITLLTASVSLEHGELRRMNRDLELTATRIYRSSPELRLSTAETLLEILQCPVVVRREVRIAALETIMSIRLGPCQDQRA